MDRVKELTVSIPEPNPKQKLFLADKHKYVAFGGARGGGKSWAVRTKAILLALAHAGIRICIVRKTYDELTRNHIEPLKSTLPQGSYRYNDSKKLMVFPNGSPLYFRYCDTEKDLEKFQGTEYDVVFVDEATQFTEMHFRKICACVRGVNYFPKRVYLTCNPGGVGHGWVKRLFIDRNFKSNENPDDYSFIKSLVTDNTALLNSDKEYVAQLEALPPKIRRAWLDGDWDIYEGQFFEDFINDPEHYKDRQWTHVIDPFPIPRFWKIYRSFDWGYSRPFSVGYWAVDNEDTAYRIYEWYGCTGEANTGLKLDKNEVFRRMAELEQEHPLLRGRHILGVADPAIWEASHGESIEETAAKHKIYFEKGDNKRIAGWMQCHYRLAFDHNGYSKVYVFSTCKDFIRTIPLLVYSETHPEDLDTDGEDHIADEFRYFCMCRPINPPTDVSHRFDTFNPAYYALDIKPEDLRRY